jgi:hypothetical protein
MKKKSLILALSAAALLTITGCSSSTDSTKDATATSFNGIFVDSPVNGIKATCAGKTFITGSNGIAGGFGPCPIGSSVAFSVGNVDLGTIANASSDSDLIFTPKNLTANNSQAEANKIAAFLLSLDDDGDFQTTVDVTDAAIKALDTNITTSTSVLNITTAQIDSVIEKAKATQAKMARVTEAEAESHMKETEEKIKDGTIKKPQQPAVVVPTGAAS